MLIVMDQSRSVTSCEGASSANQNPYYQISTATVGCISQLLKSDDISCEEKNFLQQFYSVAAARLQLIFSTKRYRDRLIYNSICGSNREANPIEEDISTFETLFNDCLREIMVLIFIPQLLKFKNQ